MSVSSLVSLKFKAGAGRPHTAVSRRGRKLLLALGVAAALTACGKKGDLELPPVEPVLGDEQSSGDAQ